MESICFNLTVEGADDLMLNLDFAYDDCTLFLTSSPLAKTREKDSEWSRGSDCVIE